MKIDLKYGCNPHQKFAQLITSEDPSPLKILNGNPSYINMLDALGAWQLAKELCLATGKAAAASFKHVSPAGAAVAGVLTQEFRRAQMVRGSELSPVATAYARARGGDRMSSFGDAIGVSERVDMTLARLIKREVSDLIIAPGFNADALEILKSKKKGSYLVIQMDFDYEPHDVESREVFGQKLMQQRNSAEIGPSLFDRKVTKNRTLPEDIVETLVVGTVALKYTQSNSVCVAYDGQVVGMGAGQQSRIHCTRLACDKADKWIVQQHPKVLELRFKEGLSRAEKTNIIDAYLLWDQLSEHERAGVRKGLRETPQPISKEERSSWIEGFEGLCLCSEAFLPFRDNIDRAHRSNVRYIAHPGGSLRDNEVIQAANQYDMVMIHTDLRCFLH
ncbi:phosphoribosylaminoimidazolecarboxamide formyltransferase [Candidatus Hydrogenedentota bacterium]